MIEGLHYYLHKYPEVNRESKDEIDYGKDQL